MDKKIFKLFKICLLFFSTAIFSSELFASGFQVFNGLAYNNPANLPLLVKNEQFIFGDDHVSPRYQFKGSTIVPLPAGAPSSLFHPVTTSGTSVSTHPLSLPYGRVAARVPHIPNLVLAIDVTKPFATNVTYPLKSAVRYAGTEFAIDSTDISPNFGFQFPGFLSNLYVGAGWDILRIIGVANQAYPSFPAVIRGTPPIIVPFGAGADHEFDNKGTDWTHGWHAGVLYKALKGTLVGISYYSEMTPTLRGTGTFTGFASKTVKAELPLPASTHLRVTQFLSEHIWTSFNLHYTQWSRLQSLVLQNAAGPISTVSSTFGWRNTWRYGMQTFFSTYNDKLILGTLVATDETPATGANVGALTPTGNVFDLGVTAEYKITKNVSLLGEYVHIWAQNSHIKHTSANGTIATGSAKVKGDVYGFNIKIDI